MADTKQVVRWSFDPGKLLPIDWGNYFMLYVPNDQLEKLLWETIIQFDWQERLQQTFSITRPLWYGFWMSSPLTDKQASLLYDLLANGSLAEAITASKYGSSNVSEFVKALEQTSRGDKNLYVSMTPPGHVDFGWITTFAHCPQCKCEAPIKRWEGQYPATLLTCHVCGNTYSPAETYSSERDWFARSITCVSCQSIITLQSFTDDEKEILESHHDLHEFLNEQRILVNTKGFYDRYPDAKHTAKRAVRNNTKPDWSPEDWEVIEFISTRSFSLIPRLDFILRRIDQFRLKVEGHIVNCPVCHRKVF
jgi:hypothetical protein